MPKEYKGADAQIIGVLESLPKNIEISILEIYILCKQNPLKVDKWLQIFADSNRIEIDQKQKTMTKIND